MQSPHPSSQITVTIIIITTNARDFQNNTYYYFAAYFVAKFQPKPIESLRNETSIDSLDDERLQSGKRFRNSDRHCVATRQVSERLYRRMQIGLWSRRRPVRRIVSAGACNRPPSWVPRLAILLIDVGRRCDHDVAAILAGADPVDSTGRIDSLRLKKIVRIDLTGLPGEIKLDELRGPGPVAGALMTWATEAGLDRKRFESYVAHALDVLLGLASEAPSLCEISAALDARICSLARFVLAHARELEGCELAEGLLSDLRWRVARQCGEHRVLLLQLREARDSVRLRALTSSTVRGSR